MNFEPMQKIARFNRTVFVSEKIDGTNASIHIGEDGSFQAASKNRFITPEDDNFGFATWAEKNKADLLTLGPGSHFGEWWGVGVQRNYGIHERRFSLFDTHRWGTERPACCRVVPILWTGLFADIRTQNLLETLAMAGSMAEPGFMNPEGIVIFHPAAKTLFKRTIENDAEHKGAQRGPLKPPTLAILAG